MKYYVADLHFGHRNILSLCNRPFQTVEQMDQTLISNWNSTVSDQDEVYIVGDLFYRSTQVETILKQLKGKKILIVGNHDIQWINDDLITKYFSSVHQWLEITDQHQRVFLAHYPMLSYPKQSTTYMIHGHIHTDTLLDYWPVLLKRERVLNTGVDINHFKPVTLNELIKNNHQYKNYWKDSYPSFFLSVRLNQRTLVEMNCDYTKAISQLDEFLTRNNISRIKEGLYKLDDESKTDFILQFLNSLSHSEYALFFNHFDLIHVNQQGQFSFVKKLYS